MPGCVRFYQVFSLLKSRGANPPPALQRYLPARFFWDRFPQNPLVPPALNVAHNGAPLDTQEKWLIRVRTECPDPPREGVPEDLKKRERDTGRVRAERTGFPGVH